MAGGAVIGCGMREGPLESLLDRAVTGRAQLSRRGRQQGAEIRCVGGMTVETVTLGEGQMNAGQVTGTRPFVAIEADGAARGGLVICMTDRAIQLGMRRCSEQVLAWSGVWLMTRLTIRAGNRHSEVVLLEATRSFMTRGAKIFHWGRQHGRFGGSMRIVTL